MERTHYFSNYLTDESNSVINSINSLHGAKIYLHKLLLKLSKYFSVSAVYATQEIQTCNTAAFIELLPKNIVEKVIFNNAELTGAFFQKFNYC